VIGRDATGISSPTRDGRWVAQMKTWKDKSRGASSTTAFDIDLLIGG
jgi:hypothetical protein